MTSFPASVTVYWIWAGRSGLQGAECPVSTRDGPKFGRCRSSADAEVRQMPKFGRCRSSADAEVRQMPKFGRRIRPNVRLGNMRLFGRSLAEFRQTFSVIVASNWRHFALAAGFNQSQYTYY